VIERNLAGASTDIANLNRMVEQASQRGKVHPAELLQIMGLAKAIRTRTSSLSEKDLARAGWPHELLKRMRDMTEGFENWQHSEAAAKGVVTDIENASLDTVVVALSDLLVAWCRLIPLSDAAPGQVGIDLDLQRRAQATMPLVSALLDHCTPLAKASMDAPPAQRLLILLTRALEQPGLEGLGATPILSQALSELKTEVAEIERRRAEEEPILRAEAMRAAAEQAKHLKAPDELWHAVTSGNLEIVETIIYQGGLVSGQTRDQTGHSVFWDAVAFQQADVALLLLKHFTPGTPHGVDLMETHHRNGNSLLHLISSIKNFTPSATELFWKVFSEIPEGMYRHCNARGQTFVHTAAGHLNLWILKCAANGGLFADFSALDNAGWSPRRLLDYHLSSWRIAEEIPPAKPLPVERCRIPPWCRLPIPGSVESPFTDVVVTVCEESSGAGALKLPAHAVVLATISSEWHRELQLAWKSGSGAPVVLTVDPESCRSGQVLNYVLNFAYTGDVSCSFETNGPLLWQLLCLCARYNLPSTLSERAKVALLRCLNDPLCGNTIPALLRDAKDVGLSALERQFVARHFISQDAAWHGAEPAEQSTLLTEAISELEPCFSQRSFEDTMNMTSGSNLNMTMSAMGQPAAATRSTGAPDQTFATVSAMSSAGPLGQDSLRGTIGSVTAMGSMGYTMNSMPSMDPMAASGQVQAFRSMDSMQHSVAAM